MSIFSKIMASVSIKALETIRHPTSSGWFWRAPKASVADMSKQVGTGLGANVVMSPIRWIQRNAAEAEPALMRISDSEKVEGDHPILNLLNNPNPHYSGAHLLAATLFSYETDGNAYWLIESGMGGRPRALWYTPHWLIKPMWPDDGSKFISHYSYSPGGQKQRIEIDEVVHFKNGINPEEPRLGLSPLSGLLAEIWSDMEAGSFVGALLKNGGVPGMLFSPKGDANAFNKEDVEEFKKYLTTQFGGDGRGGPLVSSVDATIEQYGFDPKQMDLSSVRNVAEERVCAALGIPSAVVGFGTGMQQTAVGATMKELRKEAWQGGIIPVLGGLAAEINTKLVPFFGAGAPSIKFFYDTSNVGALEEDRESLEKRMLERVNAGVATVNEGRVAIGLEEADGQDIYLRGFNLLEVPQGEEGRKVDTPTGSAPGAGDEGKARGFFGDSYGCWEAKLAKAHADGHEHTEFEARIARTARRVKTPPKQLAALADAIDRLRVAEAKKFEGLLEKFYDKLGKKAEASAKRFIKEMPVPEGSTLIGGGFGTKDAQSDLADRIVKGMGMKAELPIFAELFKKTYLEVAEETAKAIKGTIGLVLGVPDPVARAILATAGKRAGLIGLTKQAQASTFKALTQAAAEGLGPPAAARRIRDTVGAGPWGDKATRARVVARTEMAFATNTSSLELGKSLGAEQAMIFDARLGDTDDICEALNQTVVTLAAARTLAASEHPNGTRSFTPIPPGMKI